MPLDMGRAARSISWRMLGPRVTGRVMARVGLLVALILTLFAVFLPDRPDLRLIPTWLPLVLLGIKRHRIADSSEGAKQPTTNKRSPFLHRPLTTDHCALLPPFR